MATAPSAVLPPITSLSMIGVFGPWPTGLPDPGVGLVQRAGRALHADSRTLKQGAFGMSGEDDPSERIAPIGKRLIVLCWTR